MSDHTDPIIAAALPPALAAGLSIVPPRMNGSKQPLGNWKPYQRRRPRADELARWYATGNTGIGTVTGAVSGNLELFEFDDAETFAAFLDAAQHAGLGELVARIRPGYEEATPGDGVHWLYRCAEISGNTKLARRPKRPEEMRDPKDTVKTLIETKGEGGYVVLAPSHGRTHPSGRPYVLVSGSVATIPALSPEERRALWQLARSFDQMPVAVAPEPRPAHHGAQDRDGDRPGDAFNARASWADVLAPAGWTFVFRRGEVEYWRRPGKDRGWSATTNHGGYDLLYVFTTSTGFEAERGYSKFSAFATLNHGGDYHAAAAALSAQGYGDAPAWGPLPPTTGTPPAPTSPAQEPPDDDEPPPEPFDQAARIAALERDLAETRTKLARAEHYTETLLRELATANEVIKGCEAILSSPVHDQQLKAPYCRLLIARAYDPRFKHVDREAVPIWIEQIAEMNGGADDKTVRKWLQTMEAENLGTLTHLPGPKRPLPNGRTYETKRLALQIGPRPGEAAMSLTDYKRLMCSPTGPARRKERKKPEPIVCPKGAEDELRREWYCTVHGDHVGTDYHQPRHRATNQRKHSPAIGVKGGNLFAAEIVAAPPNVTAFANRRNVSADSTHEPEQPPLEWRLDHAAEGV